MLPCRSLSSELDFNKMFFFAAEIHFGVSKLEQSCPKICGSLLQIALEGEGHHKDLFFLVSRALVLNGIEFHTH